MRRMRVPPAAADAGARAGRHAPAPFSIHQSRSVLDAIAEMARLDTHALVVVDDTGALAGIVTERDYIHKVKLEGRSSAETPVWRVMTSAPWCASLDFTLDDVLTVMTRYGFRHMPIVGGAGAAEDSGARGGPAEAETSGGSDSDEGATTPLRPRCLGLLSVVDVMRTITEWPERPMHWPDNQPPLPGPL